MTDSQTSSRLDQLLLARGLFDSRSRARDAIARGTVRVDGAVVTKAGASFGTTVKIAVDDPASRYVSRAALKLAGALDRFALDPAGLDCLDIGASTGGFTQVLLERGAAHVVAVDVGHGQMHARLAGDGRVTNLEGLNARTLAAEHLGGRAIGCVVSDVSFISLKLALPPALRLAGRGTFCVLLIKPQFEAGREAIGKGGLLKDAAAGPSIAAALEAWLIEEMGWTSLGIAPAAITGGDGNQEYVVAGRKT